MSPASTARRFARVTMNFTAYYGQSHRTEEAEIVNVRVSAHGRRKRLPIRVKNDAATAPALPFATCVRLSSTISGSR